MLEISLHLHFHPLLSHNTDVKVTVCCDQAEHFLTCSQGRSLCCAQLRAHLYTFAHCNHIHNQQASFYAAAPCASNVKTALDFIFIKDTWHLSKISLHLWGKSSPPTAFPVELWFPVLPTRFSGCGTAMAWLRVDCWGLRLPEEMEEGSGAQEVQESPAGGTRALSAAFSPDSAKIWGLINTTISDTWHTNLFDS